MQNGIYARSVFTLVSAAIEDNHASTVQAAVKLPEC
jgi:hypothetical protein